MRILVLYDCLYPWTVGGAERWYRHLAVALAAEGHEVTYATRRQWDRGAEPELEGVRLAVICPRIGLYTAGGRRRTSEALLFGAGTLWHLLRRGRRYDVVHTASFPYFSLLAAALVRPFARYRLFVDWHELWTKDYWREYLGSRRGKIGWQAQQLCLRAPQRAFCFSRLVERRLGAEGVNGDVTVLEGQFEDAASDEPLPAEPLVVFAGRLIPEKNPVAVVGAVAKARETLPELRGVIYGDGPERQNVLAAIVEHGLEGVVEAPGFVDGAVVEDAIARALCLLMPSRREGYGLVVLEALSKGTPAVVVRGEDNAASEFIRDGENGFVVDDPDGDGVGSALVAVQRAGPDLRASTLKWFGANATRLSLQASLDSLEEAYARV